MSRLTTHPVARRVTARGLGLLALAAVAALPSSSHAQESATPEPTSTRAPVPVPTTKILAIGSFTAAAKVTPAEWQRVLPDEVRATVRLYLAGKIDQWFVKQDQSGVVFLMNVADAHEAKVLLEQLPFGPAGLMEFQFIPLGPISPLRVLLTDPPKAALDKP